MLGAASLGFGVLAIIGAQWDTEILSILDVEELPGDLRKAIGLSEVFAHGLGVAAIYLAILISCEPKRRSKVAMAVLLTLTAGLLANGMKSMFVRIRPHSVNEVVVQADSSAGEAANLAAGQEGEPPEVVKPSFWDARQRSFPSGHAATAWGLAIGLSYVFPRGKYFFGILAVIACFQRLTSGAHFPSDVLAGSAIAFLSSALLISLPRIGQVLCEDEDASDRIEKGD